MRIKCVSTTAVDGQYVNLSGGISIAGEDKTGLAVGLGVGLGVTLLPGVGFALLAIKGEKANIESGTIIPNAVILGDYYINAQ